MNVTEDQQVAPSYATMSTAFIPNNFSSLSSKGLVFVKHCLMFYFPALGFLPLPQILVQQISQQQNNLLWSLILASNEIERPYITFHISLFSWSYSIFLVLLSYLRHGLIWLRMVIELWCPLLEGFLYKGLWHLHHVRWLTTIYADADLQKTKATDTRYCTRRVTAFGMSGWFDTSWLDV